ncbi:MAG: universal stress protein [Bacteroidetes bacterium]|nr:universal stress protein [Bacteroidota bacterium]
MIHFNASKILIPVDFSETSLLAIKHGAYIAQQNNAQLHLLHVVNSNFVSQDIFIPLVSINQNEIEAKAAEKLRQLADDVKNEYKLQVEHGIAVGSPAFEISHYAKENHINLIVMGTHGYSPIEELVIGSVALKVITKSDCPVMAMSSAATHSGYKKILIPLDDTVNSRQKVNYALQMAKKFNASVYAFGMLTGGESFDEGAMNLVLHQIAELAAEYGVEYHKHLQTDVKNRAKATVEYSNKIGADLVIIMTDQDSELSGFFLGPYSQQIIHLSEVPVIAIKPKDLFVTGSSSPVPRS